MQSNTAFQDAIARAREIAQKLTASAPHSSSLKRPNSEDESANKRPAFTSPTNANETADPVLRAQQIAQKINSQLGVKPTIDPVTNQLSFQEDYQIPDKFVGLIIGKGGEQIIRLQAESGCKVVICQTRAEAVPGGPNPPDRIASLSGTRESIDRAKRIMDDIIMKGKMAQGDPITLNPYSLSGNGISIDVLLPSAKCGLVIGKGGENIKRVSEEFGVKLYVAQETSDIDGIEHKPLRIMGEPDRVERAKQHVLESLSKSSNMPPSSSRLGSNSNSSSINDYGSRITGSAPITGPCNEASYHVAYEKAGLIIGKGGESIKEINRKSGAFVEVDKSYNAANPSVNEKVFKLRGTPEQIILAQQLMYDKVANGPGGPGDTLPPLQFQQQFNLPLVGTNSADSWNPSSDPYNNGANSADPYSNWANYSQQWSQFNSYGDGTSKTDANADPSAMGQMDPAWVAYYQQSMNYYNMMQSAMTTSSTTSTTTTKATDSTANTNDNSSTAASSSASGQADYSKQWIEYYRSVGQNDLADQIAQQMKDPSASSATGTNPWAAYAQQWAASASTPSNPTNGTNSSTTTSS